MRTEELQKHTLNLYKGDFEELAAIYPNVEPSKLIRELVRACINNAKAGDPKADLTGLKLELPL